MTWRELEREAPEIARLGEERLAAAGVALLGTLRPDGSPRISPVEPYLARGQLLFGSMWWSLKTRDLLRDPRCVLHSAVSAPNSGEGELKLYGRAAAADPAVRDSRRDAWWVGRPPAEAPRVFALTVEQAMFVGWDLERGRMTVRRWSEERGYQVTERAYP